MREDRGVSTPYPRGSSPLPSPSFSSQPPPPNFLFSGTPAKIQILCRPSDTAPPILRQHPPPPPPVLTHLPKIVQIGWGHHVDFRVWKKNRPFLAKGVWKCRLRNVGSLGSASVSDSLIWSGNVVNIMHCCCVFKIVVLYFKRRLVLYRSQARMRLRSPFRNYSVEAFYNDVPEYVGMKTLRKTHIIHSSSMTFRQMLSFVWKAIFIKGAS